MSLRLRQPPVAAGPVGAKTDRLRAVLQAGLARHVMDAGGVATVQARNTGVRAGAAVAPIGWIYEYNPFDAKERTIIRSDAARAATWVPSDNSCLFHALYQSYCIARQWMPATVDIPNAASMRDMICNYMQVHSEQFKQHAEMIVGKVRGTAPNPPSYEEALEKYIQVMRGSNQWGGYPEIDAASMMLNVIVHQFNVVGPDDGFDKALLAASFYPTQDQLSHKDARRGVPKFVLILKGGHFWYVPPQQPRPPQDAAQPTPTSTAPAARPTWEEVQAYALARSGHRSGTRTSADGTNSLTRDLKDAREARKARQNQSAQPSGSCFENPVANLTDEQYARLLQQQEIQDQQQEILDQKYARLLHQDELRQRMRRVRSAKVKPASRR